jgi:hypothetical protein
VHRFVLIILVTLYSVNILAQEDIDAKTNNCEAEFPGGIDSLFFFLKTNLDYSKFNQIDSSGQVMIRFIIDTTGFAGDLNIYTYKRSLTAERITDSTINKEILRVFNLMSRWKPAYKLNYKVLQDNWLFINIENKGLVFDFKNINKAQKQSAVYCSKMTSSAWLFLNASNLQILSINPQIGIYKNRCEAFCITLNADVGLSGLRTGLGFGFVDYNHGAAVGLNATIEYINLYKNSFVNPLWADKGFQGVGLFIEGFWYPKIGIGLYKNIEGKGFIGQFLIGIQLTE